MTFWQNYHKRKGLRNFQSINTPRAISINPDSRALSSDLPEASPVSEFRAEKVNSEERDEIEMVPITSSSKVTPSAPEAVQKFEPQEVEKEVSVHMSGSESRASAGEDEHEVKTISRKVETPVRENEESI